MKYSGTRDEGITFSSVASRTSVVLVGTLYGGNIGAVARVMNNFGFSDLRLVSPVAGLEGEAEKLAMNSKDILRSARVYEKLEDAVGDADVTVGTTRRLGRHRSSFFTPPAMAGAVAGLRAERKAAIVFGPEDAGLSNDHIDMCDWLVTIRTESEFDSMNLSHAVAVTLYEISRFFSEAEKGRIEHTKMVDGLLGHLEDLLRSVSFIPAGRDSKRVMLTLRRMLDRAGWSRSEIDLFHSILAAIEKKTGR